MEIIKNLQEQGLSEKEAKVYVACLELGDTTAGDVSFKSKLPRTLVYDLLSKLIEKGLIAYVIKNNIKYFKASEPQQFIKTLKEKQKGIEEILPQLTLLQKSKSVRGPQVEVYEGKEGMKAVMNDILKSKVTEFFAYGSSRSSWEVIPTFMHHWHNERIKQKIMMNVLYNNTKATKEKIKKAKESLQYVKYKLMPIELESPTAFVIYGDKVVLQSWTKEPFAVMIENKEMAKNHKKYFEALWMIAKR